MKNTKRCPKCSSQNIVRVPDKQNCTNIKQPREGKKEYIGQTFRDISYYVPDGLSKSGRSQKIAGIRTIYDITERACDHDGQYYISPKIECDMYSVNVDFPDEEIIELYHRHGEMEQYHSEIRTDLCAEQFPSGKFKTNELVLELIQLACNILRMTRPLGSGKQPALAT